VVLYLDIPLEVAEQRGCWGDERYEKRDMQQQVGGAAGGVHGHDMTLRYSGTMVQHLHCGAVWYARKWWGVWHAFASVTLSSWRLKGDSAPCALLWQVQRKFKLLRGMSWHVIDAARDADAVAADIAAAVTPALEAAAAGQRLRTLWDEI
jgi:hypothetical protein